MWLCRDCHDYSCAGGQLGYVSAVGDDCLKAARLETATVQQCPLTLMVAVRQCLKRVALGRAERDTDHRDNPRTRSLRPC